MYKGICGDMIERRLVQILLLNAGKRNDRRYMRFTRNETKRITNDEFKAERERHVA